MDPPVHARMVDVPIGYVPDDAETGVLPVGSVRRRSKNSIEAVSLEASQNKFRAEERARAREGFRAVDHEHFKGLAEKGEVDKLEAGKMAARGKMLERTKSSVELALTGAGVTTVEGILEEELSTEPQSWFGRQPWVRNLRTAIAKEKHKRDQATWQHPIPRFHKLVVSPQFEALFMLVMIVNCVMVGMLISDDSNAAALMPLEHLLTVLFFVEIPLRAVAYGWTWFFSYLNQLDLVLVVATGIVPLWILMPAGIHSGRRVLLSLQVLRVLRIARIVMMFRSKAFLRTAYKLSRNLFGSCPIVFHTNLIIFVGLFVLSVFAVNIFQKAGTFEGTDGEALVWKYFGDVGKASFTIFQVMTLDQWTPLARQLMPESTSVLIFYIVTIMLMTVLINNLVTAIIIQTALGRNDQDQEMIALERRERLQEEEKKLKHVFAALDTNENGHLSFDELQIERMRKNPYVEQALRPLDLSVQDITDVGEIYAEMFLKGKRRSQVSKALSEKGLDQAMFIKSMRDMALEAKARDSFSNIQRVKRLNERIARLSARVVGYKGMIENLRAEATAARRDLAGTLHEVKQFVELAGACIPSAPAPVQKRQDKAKA